MTAWALVLACAALVLASTVVVSAILTPGVGLLGPIGGFPFLASSGRRHRPPRERERPERWIQSTRRRGKAHCLRGSGTGVHARTWCGLWLWRNDHEDAGLPALVYRCKRCMSHARVGRLILSGPAPGPHPAPSIRPRPWVEPPPPGPPPDPPRTWTLPKPRKPDGGG